jgi:hypothetical protein
MLDVQERHEYLWSKVGDTLCDQVVATLVSVLVAGEEATQVDTSLILQKYLKSLGEAEYRYMCVYLSFMFCYHAIGHNVL